MQVGIAIATLMVATLAGAAQASEPFYKGKRLTVRVPDQVELGVEIEQDGDGMELEIEIGWKGGPLAG